MRAVNMKKDELQGIVQKNRDEHRGIYEEAIEGYRKAAVAWLNKQLDRAKADKKFSTYFREPIPEDHTEDYDTVLEMLKHEQEDIINLSQQEFRQFVLDEWGWKQTFTATTANYLGERDTYPSR